MNRKKDEDEAVDGPGIAAQILNRMSSENKARIVKSIQQSNPELATKIEEKLFNFEEIADLTPQGMQLLLKEVAHADVVLSLKKASPHVKSALMQNISERKQQMLEEDFINLPPVKLTDVENAQRRILFKLDELRKAGLIRTQSKNDVWV